MLSFEAVLCAAAALCVSGRGALLYLIIVPLTQLFATAVHFLWRWWGLAHEKTAATITAVAFGGALWRCFSAVSVQNNAELGPLLPLCALFVLCGFAADGNPSWKGFVKGTAAMLTVGFVRELLSTASLFGIPFGYTAFGEVFGRSSGGALGVGGLLVTAAVVWMFGLSTPLHAVSLPAKRDILFAALFTAAASAVLGLSPSLSTMWRFFAVITAMSMAQTLLAASSSPWLSFLSAVAVCLPQTLSPLVAVGIGGAVALSCLIVPRIANRLGRAPLPRRFSGAPLLLTFGAFVIAFLSAV